MTETRRLRAALESVVLALDDWKDAEERYRSPKPSGKTWADSPNSIGANMVRNQIESAQSRLKDMHTELSALLSEPQAAPDQSDDDLRDAIIDYRREVERLKKIGLNQYGEPQAAQAHPVFGTWPGHCEQRAFVEGAKWQLFKESNSTMFPSERDAAEEEAINRYGVPPVLPAPPEGQKETDR